MNFNSLRKEIKSKNVSVKELVSDIFSKIDSKDPEINSYICTTKDNAIAQAVNIDNLIQTGAGITLSTLSVSGLMCINSIRPGNRNTNNNEQTNCCPCPGNSNSPGLNCSRINLNLGLSAMGVTGAMLVYRGLRM